MELADLAVIVGIQVIIFLILVLLLRRIISSASRKELKRLQDLSLKNERKAQKLAKEAEKAEDAYKRKVASSDAEVKKLKKEAREEAQQQKEKMLKNARAESEKIIKQAMSSRDNMRKELKEQQLKQSTEVACQLIRDIFTREKLKWFHDGLVSEVVDAVDEMDADHFQAVAGNDSIEVRTPYELDPEKQQKLKASFEKNLGRDVEIKQVSDKEIIAGMTMTAGSLYIDGSLAGKLIQAVNGQEQEQ